MKYFLFVIVFLIVSTMLQAQDSLFMFQFSKRLQNYFVDPSFEKLKDLALEFKEIPAFKEPANQPGSMGFFYAAFKKTKDKTALKILIEKDCADNELLVKAYLESKSKENILIIDTHHPELNDFYWGAFLGSGERQYVERITFELENMQDRINADLYSAAASAKWLLCINAQKFTLVRQYLEEIKKSASPRVKEEIESLLSMEPLEISNEMIKVLKEITDKKQIPAQEEAK